MESNTVSMTLNDINNRTIVSFANAAGGSVTPIVENNSFYVAGTYANLVGVLFVPGSVDSDSIAFEGNQFGAEDAISLVRSSGDQANHTWSANWYSAALGANFQVNTTVTIETRTTWQADVDPDGKYDGVPVYADESTLVPDGATAGVRNRLKAEGPKGVNQRPYDLRFGAYQFGKLTYATTSRRGRSRTRGSHRAVRRV